MNHISHFEALLNRIFRQLTFIFQQLSSRASEIATGLELDALEIRDNKRERERERDSESERDFESEDFTLVSIENFSDVPENQLWELP